MRRSCRERSCGATGRWLPTGVLACCRRPLGRQRPATRNHTEHGPAYLRGARDGHRLTNARVHGLELFIMGPCELHERDVDMTPFITLRTGCDLWLRAV